jgi:hypothetical protein
MPYTDLNWSGSHPRRLLGGLVRGAVAPACILMFMSSLGLGYAHGRSPISAHIGSRSHPAVPVNLDLSLS